MHLKNLGYKIMLQDQVVNILSTQISFSKKILIMKITVILAISSVCVQSAKYFLHGYRNDSNLRSRWTTTPEAGYFFI